MNTAWVEKQIVFQPSHQSNVWTLGASTLAFERSTNSIDVRLGQRVRMRRLEIGMSQERLAKDLGITFQQVQKYEKGVNRISASRLFQIAAVVELPIAQFFEGLALPKKAGKFVVPPSDDDRVLDMAATSEGVQLMKLFAAIESIKVRRRVIDLVRTMAEADAGPTSSR